MRFLVVGSEGSMGQRRISCLRILGHEWVGYDITMQTPFPSHQDYNAWFICTPPDSHEEYFESAHIIRPTFSEASVIPYKPLPHRDIYPSCTLRFHPIVNQIRDQVKNTKPVAFTYHVGNWLLDWHPEEDYRHKYFAQKSMGGCREIVAFENEWLVWTFGSAEVISAYHGKLSGLEMKADDYYAYTLKFSSGIIGNIVIDVLSRPSCREFKLIYEGYSQYYDLQHIPWEEVYLNETRAFVEAIQGKRKWEYTVKEDLENLELLGQIEGYYKIAEE